MSLMGTQNQAGVQVSAARESGGEPASSGLAAGNVTRTNSQVSACLPQHEPDKEAAQAGASSQRPSQSERRSLPSRPQSKPAKVCATQTVLNGAVQNVNLGILS